MLFNTYFINKNQYTFDNTWEVNTSLDRVWDELVLFEKWPLWWEGLESIHRKDSLETLGRGSRIRSSWKGTLPYCLTFDSLIRAFVSKTYLGFSVTGDLEGYGTIEFASCPTGTRIHFSWQVAPTILWIRMSAPFARSVFQENHDQILSQAVTGFSRIFD